MLFCCCFYHKILQILFCKTVDIDIAPGEPIPPGTENEVTAEIQTTIDKCKNVPFLGLEYLLELAKRDEIEPGYLCILCEKRGDPRTIIDHLTSYKHRLKYLVTFSKLIFFFNFIRFLPRKKNDQIAQFLSI